MKNKLCWLPNALTFGNLFSGFLAIVFAIHTSTSNGAEGNTSINYFYLSMLMMFIAGICDFFDGYIARLMGLCSEFGRELDSLSDVVSFGVAPAVLIYERALQLPFNWWGIIPVGFYVCCAAGRLARFNVISSSGRKPYFVGMPIEGGAALLIAVVLSTTYPRHPIQEGVMAVVAIAAVLVAGILMISTLRFTANVPLLVRLGALVVMVLGFLKPGEWIILIPLSYIGYGLVSNFCALRSARQLLTPENPDCPAISTPKVPAGQ